MTAEFDTTIPDLKIDLKKYGVTDSTYEEISDRQLRKMYDETIRDVEEGTILTGRIIAVRESDVLVDVGYKSEGVIHRDEFPNIEDAQPGDEIEVLLLQKEDKGGNIHLSKMEADRQRAWERTLTACEGDARVTGEIKRKVKGGLMVDIGIEAFLPASQIALQNVKNIDEFIGQEIEVKVIKINHERRNVVISRRELLDEERLLKKREFLDQVKVGDVKQGMVKNVTDFGAFIDLHGIDGLLHLTDMKWGRINHPSEMLDLSQSVDVMIIGIDYDKERVSLGIKQMYDNPWLDVETKYPLDTIITGRVVNLLPYGAFVELEEGVEGLIHISEFSWTRKVNHPSEYVSLGDNVQIMVLSVDPHEQKISLGLRQTQENPWETIEERYPLGAKMKGTVRNLTTYGAFVELEDGIDGLVHVSDMSWTRKVNHPSEILKKGDVVEVAVLSVSSADRKIAFGLKQLTEDPWDRIHDHYTEGAVVTGKITNTTSFGAFIQLCDDIEGLIHISELADTQVNNVRDVVNVGDEVTGKIVRVDAAERKIAVSIKEYEHDKARGEAQEPIVEQPQEEKPKPEKPKRFEAGIDIEVPAATKPDEETAEPPATEPDEETAEPPAPVADAPDEAEESADAPEGTSEDASEEADKSNEA